MKCQALLCREDASPLIWPINLTDLILELHLCPRHGALVERVERELEAIES